MSSLKTRIFKNGNSQAVRIPQEFRLDTAQVEISRNANGDGDLVIHPLLIDLGAALLDALKNFDEDFVNALEQNYREQSAMQDRENL